MTNFDFLGNFYLEIILPLLMSMITREDLKCPIKLQNKEKCLSLKLYKLFEIENQIYDIFCLKLSKCLFFSHFIL